MTIRRLVPGDQAIAADLAAQRALRGVGAGLARELERLPWDFELEGR